jgi:hypothetical protein
MDLLRKGETPSIALIRGESAIVDQDVEASLGEARSRYRMDKRPVNLTDPSAVAEAIAQAAGGPYHLLALIRGEGKACRPLTTPRCGKRSPPALSPSWWPWATRPTPSG